MGRQAETEMQAAKVLDAALETDSIVAYDHIHVRVVAALLRHEAPRAALLDALGHSPDCVAPDHYRKVWQEEHDRADGWMRNCSWQPCSQDTENPCETGWMDGDLNGDEVCPPCWARLSLRDDTGTCVGCGNMTNGWFADGDKGPGWYCGWCPPVPGKPGIALSADADTDAEPDQRSGVCGCGHVASKHAQGWKGCSVCACVEYADADAEPEPRDAELRDRAEQVAAGGADFCTAWNDEFGLCDRPPDHPGAHERVTGLGATVTWRDAEPSRAEGDEQPKSLNDLAREWGLPPLTWVHMGFIEPHEPAPDVDGAYMNHEMGRLEAPCLNCRNKIVVAIPNHAEGGRPREADPQGSGNPIRTGDASVDGGGDDGRSRAIEAATQALRGWRVTLVDSPSRYAREAIDAALASGGVRLTDPGEPDISAEAYWAVSEERDKAEGRVREVERESSARSWTCGCGGATGADGKERTVVSDVCPQCHLSPCGTPEKCYRHHQRIVDRLRGMEEDDSA